MLRYENVTDKMLLWE